MCLPTLAAIGLTIFNYMSTNSFVAPPVDKASLLIGVALFATEWSVCLSAIYYNAGDFLKERLDCHIPVAYPGFFSG